jgi:hypothetical protein
MWGIVSSQDWQHILKYSHQYVWMANNQTQERGLLIDIKENFNMYTFKYGACSRVLLARRSWVRFPMRSLDVFSLPNLSSCTMALGSTQPVTEISTRNLLGGKGWPAHKAESLIAMWEPQHLIILWGFHGLLQGYLLFFFFFFSIFKYKKINLLRWTKWRQKTFCSLQAYLGDIAGLVPDHRNKANFWFPCAYRS